MDDETLCIPYKDFKYYNGIRGIIYKGKFFKKYDDYYYVSIDGEVFSTYIKRTLKWAIDARGYPRVDIHSKHKCIHRLVYEVWIKRPEEGHLIRHYDDNIFNTHASNLLEGTQKDNIGDCVRNGHRDKKGFTHYLTIYDKRFDVVKTFCPAYEFMEYCGHFSANGSVKKLFKSQWFKRGYEIIEYELGQGVTTMGDECNPVE